MECTNCNKKNIQIEDLMIQLQDFIDWREITKYKITERFIKNNNTYYLSNLCFDIEDGEVISDDAEGVLEVDSVYVLRMFLVASLINIIYSFDTSNNKYSSMIYFKDGTILIEALID